MKNLTDIKETLRNNKERFVTEYGIISLAIFGSYARGEQTKNSDIDILVDFQRPVGIEFIDLANELERILKNKVDLVSKKGIKAKYFKEIEQDLHYV